MTTQRWESTKDMAGGVPPAPPLLTALRRGLFCRCPECGEGHVFRGYLTVVDACEVCGSPLGLARADDAPPYFTILIVGHIIVPLLYTVDRAWQPSMLTMSALFLPMTLGLSLGLLRPIKGATVGLMLHLNMLKPGSSPAV